MISLDHFSHKDPQKYRVNYEDASKVFAGEYFKNSELPVKYTESKVAIIGGGFSGIAAAIQCLKNPDAKDFVMFEKHDNFGGTWYANTYPGCASDIPAVWYSLSTDMNNTWSSVQPPQYEIEEYILRVTDKYNLRPRMTFSTAVEKMVYNDLESNWTMYIRDLTNGQQIVHVAKIVIANTGALVVPSQLNSKGLENFRGKYMHSAVYDHSVPIKGKKVVVVGSGCSACQLVPSLLDNYEPESVVQVARSTQYIVPPVPSGLHALYRRCASSFIAMTLLRFFVMGSFEMKYPLFRGMGFIARWVRKGVKTESLAYMNEKCPEKYKKIIIPDFTVGCKRLIFDRGYMDCLSDPRVTMISANIQEVTEDSVIFTDGTVVKADVIIACTGYNLNKSYASVEIIGSNGFNATKMWKEKGPCAYNTVLVKNAPNLFVIGGPNITTGHGSFVESCENALKYAAKISKNVLDGTYDSVCVKPEVYEKWYVQIQKDLKTAVFGNEFGGCKSWYATDGYNSTTYPYSQIYFWWACRYPKYRDLDYVKSDSKSNKKSV